jgi:hypothetical protein
MATNSFIEFRLDEAQALADYTSIAFDLRTACDFAIAMLEENQKPAPNFSLCDPFMVATIIRYASAFSGGVRLKFHEAAVSVLTEQQRANHAHFMHVRDKYIAHSVNAFEESEPVARYWVESLQQEGITAIECNHRHIVGLSEQDLKDIIDLASTWLQYVQQKLREEKASLLPIVRKIPLEDLFRTAPRPIPRQICLNHRHDEGNYETFPRRRHATPASAITPLPNKSRAAGSGTGFCERVPGISAMCVSCKPRRRRPPRSGTGPKGGPLRRWAELIR